ncbi:hypothetical protein LCGC14_0363730 [marine sediment metagenome]|uniref:ribonuclease H n=1 Tax=marine sediment metagenome TaxID=412755 RepID=A0A0F9TCT8_9ZZZZ
MSITIYTDGSCKGNPGPGGWAAVFLHSRAPRVDRFISGGAAQTTNNRMELTAAIKGLEAIGWGTPITIYSDSMYIVGTMTKGWQRRYNVDLWDRLDKAAEGKDIEWVWVKGHDGNVGNEEADRIAQAEAEKWRSIIRD